jgi:hypothetical protein
MQKLTSPNPYYAELNAELRVLCDDFHYATIRADIADAVTTRQHPTGWVTFTTFRLHGQLMLVQKNDGSTRTIPATSQRAHTG